MNRMRMITSFRLLLVVMIAAAVGCSTAPDGPPRYALSGEAEYDGEPIPFGRILLEPDTSQGNAGPAAVADIQNGEFRTRPDAGHVGGKFKVTIIATDGSKPASPDVDNSLFSPFHTTVDLPAEDSRHSFTVPRDGAT